MPIPTADRVDSAADSADRGLRWEAAGADATLRQRFLYGFAMAGHSKWANIRIRSRAQDAKRGKIFTKLIREITAATRAGGVDPVHNPRLRHAIDRRWGTTCRRTTSGARPPRCAAARGRGRLLALVEALEGLGDVRQRVHECRFAEHGVAHHAS